MSKNKSNKRKSYNWAVVSMDGKVLREMPTGRRAIYVTRDAARTALKSARLCKGGSVPKTPQKAIQARVMKRSEKRLVAQKPVTTSLISDDGYVAKKDYGTTYDIRTESLGGTTSYADR